MKQKWLEKMKNIIKSSFGYSPSHQIWESMAAGILLPAHQLPGTHHKNKGEKRKTFQIGLFFSAHFVFCDEVSNWLGIYQES